MPWVVLEARDSSYMRLGQLTLRINVALLQTSYSNRRPILTHLTHVDASGLEYDFRVRAASRLVTRDLQEATVERRLPIVTPEQRRADICFLCG